MTRRDLVALFAGIEASRRAGTLSDTEAAYERAKIRAGIVPLRPKVKPAHADVIASRTSSRAPGSGTDA